MEINPNIYCGYKRCKRLTKNSRFCPEHKKQNKYLSGILSLSYYHDNIIKELCHYLKYEGLKELVKTLDFIDLDKLQSCLPVGRVQFIYQNSLLVPVPLYSQRQKIRGYNQAAEIAKYFAQKTKIAIAINILKRVKKTESQIELKNDREREKNVENAFALVNENAGKIKGKTIYLVDDVSTSGATLRSCAKALFSDHQHKPRQVFGLVLAKR